MEPSIFTKIINKEIPGYIIDETEEFIAFLERENLSISTFTNISEHLKCKNDIVHSY